MFNWLVRTENCPATALLRVVLGVVFTAHGAQKVLGLWGGPGISGTITGFQAMGLPEWVAICVMIAEFVGGIFLILGFLTRLAALGIALVMGGAIWLVHLPNGFFMNWMGNLKGEGFEFHLLAIAIALTLVLKGGGWLSIDRRLEHKS